MVSVNVYEKSTLSETTVKFLLQEHSLLRGNLQSLITDLRTVERDVLAAVGVITGFLVLHPPVGKDRWAWWTPALFTCLGAARAWTIRWHIVRCDRYLQFLELVFIEPDYPGGFQTFTTDPSLHAKVHSIRFFWQPY